MTCKMVSRLSGGSDVEEGQLVPTFVIVAFSDIDGIASIAQTEESLHALTTRRL